MSDPKYKGLNERRAIIEKYKEKEAEHQRQKGLIPDSRQIDKDWQKTGEEIDRMRGYK